jgi:hypothetical protein
LVNNLISLEIPDVHSFDITTLSYCFLQLNWRRTKNNKFSDYCPSYYSPSIS